MKWWAGWNNPGCLPDTTPEVFDTWAEAHQHLVVTIGEWFAQDRGEIGPPVEVVHEYNLATTALATAVPEYPASVYYQGQVLWLADLES